MSPSPPPTQSIEPNEDDEESLEVDATASQTETAAPQDPTCQDTTADGSIEPDGELKEINPVYLPKDYVLLPERFDVNEFPESYLENNEKEARLIDYCRNFRRQYANLCPDRTRLLLSPVNECGIEKFVCTTLHPIQLPYPELYTWDGAASFVSDFLEFVPLVPSTELPKRLLSPSTTVRIQKGTCFEYATLLCSLLLGVGYDAYVVSGYATRECCYMDETRLISPYKKQPIQTVASEEETESKKYIIRAPKDLTSQYEKACTAKELKAESDRIEREQAEAEAEEEELCKPPNDPLYGLRVHAWVLVLAGKREVPEAFFIETLTGLAQPLNMALYLGIESLWNANNYWANMQDCSTGISNMEYNLDNGLNWEYLLPSGSLQTKQNPNDTDPLRNQPSEATEWLKDGINVQSTLNFELTSHDSSQSSHIAMPTPMGAPQPMGLTRLRRTTSSGDGGRALPIGRQLASLEDKLLLMDLPPSWTSVIVLDQQAYESRYPGSEKSVLYRRCKLEKYAPFSKRDGLIFRLTNYEDFERNVPIDISEKFAQRADKLLSRFTVAKRNRVTEEFDHGRNTSHLSVHCFSRNHQGPQANRSMTFYHNARVDGLEKREQTPTTMKEYYVGRKDRMCYREVMFGAKVKKFGPAQMSKDTEGGAMVCVTTSSQLSIDKVTERFTRDHSKHSDDDIAERIFHIAEDRILLTYHIGGNRIAPCTREFIKPPPTEDRRNTIQLYSDTHTTFQVNLFAKPKTQVEIFNMLVDLMNEEEVSKNAVRKSESEVRSILNERTAEELKVELQVDLFDTLRNTEAHELRLNLERLAEEERTRCKEVELDYLAPFLAQIELIDGQLTREQAFSLREGCLQDFKLRLITKANIIQARFERETDKLQKKQQWYQLNQINLTKDDEQEYIQYCNDATFRITTLETMLSKHKQTSPQRYMALERKLRSDPRLCGFLQAG